MRPARDGYVTRPWGRALLVYLDESGNQVCRIRGRWYQLDLDVWRRAGLMGYR